MLKSSSHVRSSKLRSDGGFIHPMFMYVGLIAIAILIYLGSSIVMPRIKKWNENRLFINCRQRIERLRIAELAYYRDHGNYSDEGLARYMNMGADSLVEGRMNRWCRGLSGARWRMEPMIIVEGDHFIIEGYTRNTHPCHITASNEAITPKVYSKCRGSLK